MILVFLLKMRKDYGNVIIEDIYESKETSKVFSVSIYKNFFKLFNNKKVFFATKILQILQYGFIVYIGFYILNKCNQSKKGTLITLIFCI